MLQTISKAAVDAVNALGIQINVTSSSVRNAVVVLLVIALLLGIALSWLIIHSIRHPLNSMRDSSQQLAQSRDLTSSCPTWAVTNWAAWAVRFPTWWARYAR
jgi:methyl-accepting chemotaxis protein